MKKIYSLLCLGLFAVSAMAETPAQISSSWGPVAPQVSTAENPVWYMVVSSHTSTARQNRFLSYNGSTLGTNDGSTTAISSTSVCDGNDNYAFRLEQVSGTDYVYIVSKHGDSRIIVPSDVAAEENPTISGMSKSAPLTMGADGARWSMALGSAVGTNQSSSCVTNQYCFDYVDYAGTAQHAFLNACDPANTSTNVTIYEAGIHVASGWFFFEWTAPKIAAITDLAATYTEGTGVNLTWTVPSTTADGAAANSNVTVRIFRNSEQIAEVEGTTGATGSYTDAINTEGTYNYTAQVYVSDVTNPTLSEVSNTVAVTVGSVEQLQVKPVENASITYDEESQSITLNFNYPTQYTNNTDISKNDGNFYYQVDRNGESWATLRCLATGTRCPVTDDNLSELMGTTVTYTIYAYVGEDSNKSEGVTLSYELPSNVVEGETVLSSLTLIPFASGNWVNEDGNTSSWYFRYDYGSMWNPYSGGDCNSTVYNIRPLALKSETNYYFTAEVRLSASGTSQYNIYVGTDIATITSGTPVGSITANSTTATTYQTGNFTVSEDDNYYVAITAVHQDAYTTFSAFNINVYSVQTSISEVKAAGKVYSYGDELVLPADVTSVMVFDLQGRRVLGSKAAERISLQGLASGVYVVKAQTANGTITTKIVK